MPRSRQSRFHAAVLALGEECALSHRAAAAYWEILSGSVPIEVTVPTIVSRPRRDGIIIHRAPLPAPHVKTHNGIRVTSLIRTILDLAAVERLRILERAFEQAQVIHHLPPEPLAAEVLSRRGYRGNAKLRLILSDAVDPAAVRSILELRFLRLCANHGIPRPLVNVQIGPWTPDFLFPDQRVVVETDGYEFHRTAAARRRDALKDAYMESIGLTVIRLTWTEVTERPAPTAARVAKALEWRLGPEIAA